MLQLVFNLTENHTLLKKNKTTQKERKTKTINNKI